MHTPEVAGNAESKWECLVKKGAQIVTRLCTHCMAPPFFENQLGTLGTLLNDFPGGQRQSSRPSQVG